MIAEVRDKIGISPQRHRERREAKETLEQLTKRS
jgi:hypothetical protein